MSSLYTLYRFWISSLQNRTAFYKSNGSIGSCALLDFSFKRHPTRFKLKIRLFLFFLFSIGMLRFAQKKPSMVMVCDCGRFNGHLSVDLY